MPVDLPLGRARTRRRRTRSGGRRRSYSAPATGLPVPPISSWRDPRVEGHLGCDRCEGVGRRLDPGLIAEQGGELGEHLPQGSHVARGRRSRAQALKPPVGVGDRALLLGVGLGGEDDVGVTGGAVLEHRDREHELRLARAPRSSPAPSAKSRTGSAFTRKAASRLPSSRASRMPDASSPCVRLREPGAGDWKAADLPQAAAVRTVRHLDQTRPILLEAKGPRAVEERTRIRAGPHDHRRARPQRPRDALGVRAQLARTPLVSVGPDLGGQRGGEGARESGARSAPSPRRRRRGRSGRSVAIASRAPRRRTAFRIRRSRIGIE